MKRYILTGICLTLGIAFVACTHSKDTPVPAVNNPGNGPDTTDNTVDTSLCFERDILPVFISNCAKSGCHDAASHQEGYVFTSYQTITAKKFYPGRPDKTELYEKITEDDDDDIMPPPPQSPLPEKQIALIKDWIERGAPNTTNCAANCNTDNFTFAAAIKPVIDNNCKGCHNSFTASGGFNYETYDGVKAAVQAGRLLGSIRHETGFTSMPQGGNKLSDCQITRFEKWIAAGALNN